VLYHCASPPCTQWPEPFPALKRSILDAAQSSGAKLVFADNLYAYGPVDGPLREDLLAVAGIFSPLLREMRETTYQFRAPFVIGASKFEAVFGLLEPTPHRDAVRQTVAWYRSR
jgi:hypothetical protein